MVAGQVRQRACEEQAVHSMAARSTAEKGLGHSLSIREAPPVTLLLQLEPPPQVFIEATAADQALNTGASGGHSYSNQKKVKITLTLLSST